jgi:hypothetical protein
MRIKMMIGNCSGVNCAAEELTFTSEFISYNVLGEKVVPVLN